MEPSTQELSTRESSTRESSTLKPFTSEPLTLEIFDTHRQLMQQLSIVLKQLKKPIYKQLNSRDTIDAPHHDPEFHFMQYLFPVNKSIDLFNILMVIMDRHKLHEHLAHKNTNQWSKIVYKLSTPLMTHVVNDMVMAFMFDFIQKAMLVAGKGQVGYDMCSGNYGIILKMFLNNHMSKYTTMYIDNFVMYYTGYNGYNCTIDDSSDSITFPKNMNWSLMTYILNEACITLYNHVKNPHSSNRLLAVVLLATIAMMFVYMIKKIKTQHDPKKIENYIINEERDKAIHKYK